MVPASQARKLDRRCGTFREGLRGCRWDFLSSIGHKLVEQPPDGMALEFMLKRFSFFKKKNPLIHCEQQIKTLWFVQSASVLPPAGV